MVNKMAIHEKYCEFSGVIMVLGFGSVGRAILPLLLRHINVPPENIIIFSPDNVEKDIPEFCGVRFTSQALTKENYQEVLKKNLRENDFLLNLSVEVASLSLIEYCWKNRIFYLDTCIEPWPGRYTDPSAPPGNRTNYKLREDLLAFRQDKQKGRTAVVTQGANPGLASIFVKQALLNMAKDCGMQTRKPSTREDWAKLARELDIKVIHIAERDTQISSERRKRGEFVNTWSVDGFISEGLQPAELGWGTHERHFPHDAERHNYGCDAAIFLRRPGIGTRVRSWTQLEGSFHGFLVTHSESISIADHLTLRDNEKVSHRPTVHYAYYPCDDAVLSLHELAGRNWQPQKQSRILYGDIISGMDELGVLLMGGKDKVYWFGSRLDIHQARQLAHYNTATSLQVAAGVLAGVVWALRNPEAGIVEPDDLDHEAILQVASPYLGEVVGVYGDWTPLKERGQLFDETCVQEDPWQFINFRVQ